MNFPVELVRDNNLNCLKLKVSSLPIFGGRPVVVPDDKLVKVGFFTLDDEYRSIFPHGHWTVQKIEDELKRSGKNKANAYRIVREQIFNQEKPYREMCRTTFQSYVIPKELADLERANSLDLASACTS